MAAPTNDRKFRPQSISVSTYVDVDIDEDFLEENGYHHEEDCPSTVAGFDGADLAADLQAFSDWHDQTHGLSLWAMCVAEPCKHLTDDFRSTP
ncbi:hypothetical protein [Arthrobacter sp. PsM3]|uniref:hypothetical protein n=1 Tax=Arthrobacter sp. PsM3 TaxID=3030531 RepID=UPI00263ADF0A|nr:hypothetical protein [Arthrobacter sp. PsM3]MDN4644952.1 hypothetical protein [Arthrobacter sp. PsM3]